MRPVPGLVRRGGGLEALRWVWEVCVLQQGELGCNLRLVGVLCSRLTGSQGCQAKGWGEGGHKRDCRVLKALDDIFV